MTVEEALGLVEEVKNCSLPWDDVHWDALCVVINYVKDKLHEDFQNRWKPSEEQMEALEDAYLNSISSIQKHSLELLYNELKKL